MTQIVLAYDRSPKTLAEINREFNDLLLPLLPHIGMVKLGLETMNAPIDLGGYETDVAKIMRKLIIGEGGEVLWDAKLHDIGTTMAKTMGNIAGRVSGVTVHATSTRIALQEVVAARSKATPNSSNRPILFGVTVLTDMSDTDCGDIYGTDSIIAVRKFAGRLIGAGFDGIVCSGKELSELKKHGLTRPLQTLVPGIRPAWASVNDQKRVMTPKEAAELDADYIVVGRPILEHVDPLMAVKLINTEIREARN